MPLDASQTAWLDHLVADDQTAPPGRAVQHVLSQPSDPRETNCYGFVAWSVHGKTARPIRRSMPNICMHEAPQIPVEEIDIPAIRRGLIAVFHRPLVAADYTSGKFTPVTPANWEENEMLIQHEALVVGQHGAALLLAEKQGQGSFAIQPLNKSTYLDVDKAPMVAIPYDILMQETGLTRGQIGAALPHAYYSVDKAKLWIEPGAACENTALYGATSPQKEKLSNMIEHANMASKHTANIASHGIYAASRLA